MANVAWFKEISKKDIPLVGGKGASLGEMYNVGIPVPPGFVVTAEAYKEFLERTGIAGEIYDILKDLNVDDNATLQSASKKIQSIILQAEMPRNIQLDIKENYDNLNVNEDVFRQAGKPALDIIKAGRDFPFVAVRSSATAEDLPTASFAGQQATFLNIKGGNKLVEAVQKCWASLFTARAIYYRVKNNFPHEKVFIAVVVQKMVKSEKSGVIFSVNPMTNNENEIVIEAGWGLGEAVVSGAINPDQYIIEKGTLTLKSKKINEQDWMYTLDPRLGHTIKKNVPQEKINAQILNDAELRKLAELTIKIEHHYGSAQDIEYAIEGSSIYIVQSRPVTTLKKPAKEKKEEAEKEEAIVAASGAEVLVQGVGASPGVGSGAVKIVHGIEELGKIQKGDVLVARMTNPDYVSSMQKASAIVTDAGGSTCHAAIVSREMGIPCFSGETGILTNEGFLSLDEVHRRIKLGERLSTLSFNIKTLKTEWKKIKGSSERLGETIAISISKNGKVDSNILRTTPEHNFFTLANRNPSYKKIGNILNQDKIIYTSLKIPKNSLKRFGFNDYKAYICGAIFSDGYLRIQQDGSAQTVFTQKNTSQKRMFINTVIDYFKAVYDYELRLVGKHFFYCYKKNITEDLLSISKNIPDILLSCDETPVLNYLAGIIDGDGNFIKRGKLIQITLDKKKPNILFSLIVSCMRLGMAYRMFTEGNKYRFYISSKQELLKPYLKRVVIRKTGKLTGDVYLASRDLFSDIPVPGRRGIKSFVTQNCLLSKRELTQKVIPYYKDKKLIKELIKIRDSDLGVLRVKNLNETRQEYVYNIEVEGNHNYIVFSSNYTPMIVKNCIVGTETATQELKENEVITVDANSGKVYKGKITIEKEKEVYEMEQAPLETVTEVKVIMDLPDFAEKAAKTGADGVGLLRCEFMILKHKDHPYYMITTGRREELVQELTADITKIAGAFKGKPVWYRTLDAPTDEFRHMKGGEDEPEEDNPMMGWRSIRRSLDQPELLLAEFEAIKRVHDSGLTNVGVMLPLVTHVEQISKSKEYLKEVGLEPMENIEFGVMIETPASVQIIEEICKEGVDFISFGTNDLTQFTLACDRNSAKVQKWYNEKHPAVLRQIKHVIEVCKKYNVETSICGQAGSDAEMAEFLVKMGIDSISANPDAVKKIRYTVAKIEKKLLLNVARRDVKL